MSGEIDEKTIFVECLKTLRKSNEVIQRSQELESKRHEAVGQEMKEMCKSLARMEARSHTTPCDHLVKHIDKNSIEIVDLYNKLNGHCSDGHAGRIRETVEDGRNYTKDLLGMAFKVLGALLGLGGILFTILKIAKVI